MNFCSNILKNIEKDPSENSNYVDVGYMINNDFFNLQPANLWLIDALEEPAY